MVSIKEALEIIHAQQPVLNKIELYVEDALGYCLAADIKAPFDIPSFDNSAMDGYALCGNYQTYSIVGEVAAGSSMLFQLKERETVRIFTGGKVPDNSFAVVMQEKTSVEDGILSINEQIKEGQNIRIKGVELKEDQLVFIKGHLIDPATIGLLASLGISKVAVFKKPIVRVITTGNELVELHEERKLGQIFESNSYTLQAALRSFGFNVAEKIRVADDHEATKSAISKMLSKSDLILLSGGISVGDYDYVYQALKENGVEELYYKVFQKPGKPLFFGKKNNTYVFALPGNPASSLICFYIHVLPFLQKITGALETGLTEVELPLLEDFNFQSDRPTFLKAVVKDGKTKILDKQMSSMLHSLAVGNALVFLDKAETLKTGDLVKCFLIK
ncbi:MAG: molybdopterin molybdotransferase MoeA [Oligoflexus sp.]|nr:molybdopterin molybdotransferase MoeA [Pseudopedobacter sp.]